MQQVYLDHSVLCVLASRPCETRDKIVHLLELGLRRSEIRPLTSSHSLRCALEKIERLSSESLSTERETRLIANWSRLCRFREAGASELTHAAKLHESFSLPREFALEAALVLADGETALLTVCPEVYAELPFLEFYGDGEAHRL